MSNNTFESINIAEELSKKDWKRVEAYNRPSYNFHQKKGYIKLKGRVLHQIATSMVEWIRQLHFFSNR